MRILGVLLAFLLCTSCATVIHGRYQSVPVTSVPPGADVTVDCNGERHDGGQTPTSVTLPRRSETCSLTLGKPGYEPAIVHFDRVDSRATMANLVPAIYLGVIGAVVGFYFSIDNPVEPFAAAAAGGYAGGRAPYAIDEATGAAYKQVPEQVHVVLVPTPERR